MSAFSVENPHDGKTFENFTRFEWGVEVGVVTTFMLRLFVPHEFDMSSTPVTVLVFTKIHYPQPTTARSSHKSIREAVSQLSSLFMGIHLHLSPLLIIIN